MIYETLPETCGDILHINWGLTRFLEGKHFEIYSPHFYPPCENIILKLHITSLKKENHLSKPFIFWLCSIFLFLFLNLFWGFFEGFLPSPNLFERKPLPPTLYLVGGWFTNPFEKYYIVKLDSKFPQRLRVNIKNIWDRHHLGMGWSSTPPQSSSTLPPVERDVWDLHQDVWLSPPERNRGVATIKILVGFVGFFGILITGLNCCNPKISRLDDSILVGLWNTPYI